ncbi:MAG: CarD family transcriptional regulator [Coriobacteriia bacterium]|nr:CarD family transcriptional regulator [Coriobacteriia bacterium]
MLHAMIQEISNILRGSNELKPYYSKLDNGEDASLAVVTSARPLVVATDFMTKKKSTFVVVAGEKNAKVFANEINSFIPGTGLRLAGNTEALWCLRSGKPKIVVASASEVLRKIPDTDIAKLKPLTLKIGIEIERNTLLEKLKSFGYTRLAVLDGPGTFSVKGGTIDIFPAQLRYPVRIDFFGDEVEDIRRIVQTTGQTINSLKSVEIFFAKSSEEFEKTIQLQDMLNKNTVVYFDEPRGVLDDMRNYYDSLGKTIKMSKADRKTFYMNPLDVNIANNQNVSLVSIMQRGINPDAKLTLKRPPRHKSIDELRDALPGYKLITELPVNMTYLIPDGKLAIVCKQAPKYLAGTKGEYFDVSKLDFVDITKITFPYKPGDYVVHSFYGIALFKDIVKREIAGSIRDYLLLEYAEKDKLYVPIEQFGRITKYVGPQGTKPKVTRLGTADWSKVMSRARVATRRMAFDLVDVYSRRALAKGHAFAADNAKQKKMEADFPYLETGDQMKAINDVKSDMHSQKPMDRLICGDVGFGKTEVALRAAFKCAQDKMQVMFLCPTTILAQQHYTTFYKRLDRYGIKVEVLSRFKSAKESKQIAEDFANGKLDVLIGTHRLLSRDINPKNLGLIIIDEEQRFGVGHKEQLKNFRDSVDVLTLTATPIPRTMQMATSGVRDMSIINTPPDSRKAVEVHVGE